jgi:hypothetical protein
VTKGGKKSRKRSKKNKSEDEWNWKNFKKIKH